MTGRSLRGSCGVGVWDVAKLRRESLSGRRKSKFNLNLITFLEERKTHKMVAQILRQTVKVGEQALFKAVQSLHQRVLS